MTTINKTAKIKKYPSDRDWHKMYSTVICPELVQLGQKIESFRLEKNLTKEDFANELDVGLLFYYRISRGTARISVPTLIKIAKALGVTAKSLIDF
jgi:DNA-binding XRE family transcriptional regulator